MVSFSPKAYDLLSQKLLILKHCIVNYIYKEKYKVYISVTICDNYIHMWGIVYICTYNLSKIFYFSYFIIYSFCHPGDKVQGLLHDKQIDLAFKYTFCSYNAFSASKTSSSWLGVVFYVAAFSPATEHNCCPSFLSLDYLLPHNFIYRGSSLLLVF